MEDVVLMVVTLEDDLQTAFDHTYKELEKIQCKDLFHRMILERRIC